MEVYYFCKMNLDNVYICDIETIGYLKELSSFDDLHVLGCAYKSNNKWQVKTTNKKEDIKKIVENPNNTLVFHNGVCYDKEALKIMGFDFKAQIIDTLGLSYYLYSERDKHGLAHWGEFFNVKKPEIDDWKGLSYEEYVNRVTEDCKINTNLWVMMLSYLRELYDTDEQIISCIKYLNHKMDILRLQDKNKLFIDVEACQKNLDFLQAILVEKEEELKKIMPKVPVKAIKNKPKVLFKKDGSLSAAHIKWLEFLRACSLPEETEGPVEYIRSYKEPNPQSSQQVKDFLFSKNWKPKIFKDGANGKVPQLRDDNKELCSSITTLLSDYPELEALSGMSVAKHREGYLKSFLDKADENNQVTAWAHAFTRTLRLKHVAPCVNLPKPSATYGELVRSVIVAPEGYVCIGADLSSIEDKCKQISIYNYDPEYVKEMNFKGWDAHLALGLKAGFFTEDEVQFYKWFKSKDKEDVIGSCPESFLGLNLEEQEEAFHLLDLKRQTSKTGTYSLTYGCGIAKLMEATDLNRKESTALHKGYWDLNFSVKQFAKDRITKKVKGTNWLRLNKKAGGIKQVNELTWIWNEYTNLWLFLKNDKDRFSACNQSYGVKVFDVWGYILKLKGLESSYSAHDEYLFYCREEEVDKYIEILKQSVIELNNYFKPPVPLEIDYKIGKNYAEVH